MSRKKGRRLRKTDVPDGVPEFDSGDTGADIQHRMEERETRQREEEAQIQRKEEVRSEEARTKETHSQQERVEEKNPRIEKSDIETEAGGAA